MEPTTTEGLVQSGFDSLTTLFTGTIAPAMFAIAIAIIGVTFALSKLKKAKNAG